MEPIAAPTPERTAAPYQSLLHFVDEGNWSDEAALKQVQELVMPTIEPRGPNDDAAQIGRSRRSPVGAMSMLRADRHAKAAITKHMTP